MSKKVITKIWLLFAFTAAAVASSVTPAAAAPASPGACSMLHAGNSAVGFSGMRNAQHGQGWDNMVDLLVASDCL